MDMQRANIYRPGRQMHSFPTHFLALIPLGIVAKFHPIISSCISLWVFSYKFLQYFNIFVEHLCTMTSVSSIQKDSTATTPDSFKDCILTCKINNQVHKNFEKRKVPQAGSGNLFKNDCSARHMFCTIFVSLSVAKTLQKHV